MNFIKRAWLVTKAKKRMHGITHFGNQRYFDFRSSYD